MRFTQSLTILELNTFTESTTIALLARLSGVLEPLREFVKTKPVWGTCAGAILLSQAVENAKKGGQELLGGMSITIARNGWGSQVGSLYTCLVIILTHFSFGGVDRVIRGSSRRRRLTKPGATIHWRLYSGTGMPS